MTTEASPSEVIYASWGGNGRGSALRSAFETAVERDVPLLYLAILDKATFGDLDDTYRELVVDELEWLLDAQLRLAADQLDAEGHQARFVVQVGDVAEEVVQVAAATQAELVLIPDDAQPTGSLGETPAAMASTLAELTGASVEVV